MRSRCGFVASVVVSPMMPDGRVLSGAVQEPTISGVSDGVAGLEAFTVRPREAGSLQASRTSPAADQQ